MRLTKKVLQHRAKPVDFDFPYQNEIMARQMTIFMRSQHGIGLSATQIGSRKRMFVMECHGRLRWCFNPEILESSEVLTDFDEGCLSFPGDQCTITRPDWVRVQYKTEHGDVVEDILVGLEARCFQHELDHLDGITMWDRYKEQNDKQS